MKKKNRNILQNMHPLLQLYFIFVILFCALSNNTIVIIITTIVILIILILSDLSIRNIFNYVKIFILPLIVFVIILLLLENSKTNVVILGVLTFIKFFDMLLIGFIFFSISKPMDYTLFFLRFESIVAKRIGFAFSAGISSINILKSKVIDTLKYQQLRGSRFSLKPTQIKITTQSLYFYISSILIQTLQLADEYTASMISKGYNSTDISLPPYFSIFKLKNVLFFIFSTLYLSIYFLIN